MQAVIKAAVLKLFPELSGGLHLDRYGRVLAVADAPQTGATCERFRPRYAVDVEMLTPQLEPDPAFPVYPAVPLPVMAGAGQETGTYAFPQPGTLVVVGFAYGRPDHPIIRQMYPLGTSLPAVRQGEWLAQTAPDVWQRADADGNWHRRTHAAITDDSRRHTVHTVEHATHAAREAIHIAENALRQVGGNHTLEVGAVLTMLAGLRADLATLGDLNLTAGGNSTRSTAGHAADTTGGNHARTIKGSQSTNVGGTQTTTVQGARAVQAASQQTTIAGKRQTQIGADDTTTVQGASTEAASGDKRIEAANITLQAAGALTLTSSKGGGTNLFTELLACLHEIKAALDVLAVHTHPATPKIVEGPTVAAHAARLGTHKGRIEGVVG
jgi:hypothetical protein